MTKTKKTVLIIVSIIAAVSLLISGTVLAKYIVQSRDEKSVSAAKQYFLSDYLKPSAQSASYSVVGSSVDVSLKNYADSSNFSSADISYTVSVTNGTSSPSSGTITGGSANSTTLTVTPTNPASPVVVTASSTSPFPSSITATFNFTNDLSQTSATYLIEDTSGSDYATLKILAGTTIISANALSLSWNTSEVYLDPTNSYLMGNAAITTGTLSIGEAIAAKSTAVIYIFKEDITDNFSHAESSITSNTITIGTVSP